MRSGEGVRALGAGRSGSSAGGSSGRSRGERVRRKRLMVSSLTVPRCVSPLVFQRPRPLPTLCQNLGHTGAPRGSPVHVDPLKTPL